MTGDDARKGSVEVPDRALLAGGRHLAVWLPHGLSMPCRGVQRLLEVALGPD